MTDQEYADEFCTRLGGYNEKGVSDFLNNLFFKPNKASRRDVRNAQSLKRGNEYERGTYPSRKREEQSSGMSEQVSSHTNENKTSGKPHTGRPSYMPPNRHRFIGTVDKPRGAETPHTNTGRQIQGSNKPTQIAPRGSGKGRKMPRALHIPKKPTSL